MTKAARSPRLLELVGADAPISVPREITWQHDWSGSDYTRWATQKGMFFTARVHIEHVDRVTAARREWDFAEGGVPPYNPANAFRCAQPWKENGRGK